MRSLGAAVLLLVPVLGSFACGDSNGATIDGGPAVGVEGGADVRGKIKELQTPAPDGMLGAFLVEGASGNGALYARAWVRLKESTMIWRQDDLRIVEASADELKPGVTIEVKFEGAVAELDPVQATAGEIFILE